MTAMTPVRRITEELLATVPGVFRAVVTAAEKGRVAGLDLLDPEGAPTSVGAWTACCSDGDELAPGEKIVEITGSAAEIGAAEDFVLGPLGFAGGVARRAAEIAVGRPAGLEICCGGWKKLPLALKPALRAGLAVAGVGPRLVNGDFVYVPKNTVTLLGGVGRAVPAALRLDHGPVAIQITGVAEALAAIGAGARIIMVDDGSLVTLAAVNSAVHDQGMRQEVTIGFGGGVTPAALTKARQAGADVVDVGRAMLDAPLWDLRVQVRP
jgi:nicotinate-nucleotide pyrophosphorylase (carboxylating)